MTERFQIISLMLLTVSVGMLWRIAAALDDQKRVLGKILESLNKFYEVRDVVHNISWMMRSGEYEAPRSPRPPAEMPDLGAMMAQHNLDKLGQR